MATTAKNSTRVLAKFLPSSPISWALELFRALGGNTSKIDDSVNNLGSSLLGKYAGTNVTGAEQQTMDFNAQQAQLNRDFEERMSNTQVQRTVADMDAAGVNAALMLAGNGSLVSSPSGSTASASVGAGLGLSDLMQLALLPAQLRNISAQTKNIEANTRLTDQKKLTEEQLTKLQSIAVQWQPSINAETITQISASIDKMQAEILNLTASKNLTVAQTDLVKSQKEAQAITNYYLPAKTLSEINKLDSDARNSRASAWITEIQAKFAQDNGFLMSSNDMLLLGTYIASLFNVEKSDVETVVSKASNYVKKEFKYDFMPWRKVSPEEAMSWYLEHSND